jgi:hypothetical protein
MTCCSRRTTWVGIHSRFEIGPALAGDLDLALWDLGRSLREDVEEDDQWARAPEENAVMAPP